MSMLRDFTWIEYGWVLERRATEDSWDRCVSWEYVQSFWGAERRLMWLENSFQGGRCCWWWVGLSRTRTYPEVLLAWKLVGLWGMSPRKWHCLCLVGPSLSSQSTLLLWHAISTEICRYIMSGLDLLWIFCLALLNFDVTRTLFHDGTLIPLG